MEEISIWLHLTMHICDTNVNPAGGKRMLNVIFDKK